MHGIDRHDWIRLSSSIISLLGDLLLLKEHAPESNQFYMISLFNNNNEHSIVSNSFERDNAARPLDNHAWTTEIFSPGRGRNLFNAHA
jgi:hypothetical protein